MNEYIKTTVNAKTQKKNSKIKEEVINPSDSISDNELTPQESLDNSYNSRPLKICLFAGIH